MFILLPIRVDNEFIADNYFHKKVPSTHGGGPYHVETSPLICSANQWTSFYMIGTYVVKELNTFLLDILKVHCINTGTPLEICPKLV